MVNILNGLCRKDPHIVVSGARASRMPRLVKVLLLAATLFAGNWGGSASATQVGDPHCRAMDEAGMRYTVCSFDPARSTIRVYHMAPDGAPYERFARLSDQLWKERRVLRFATNGGMYHHDLSAVGLLREYGLERHAIITGGGYGNFHLLPNGVFHVGDGKAGVLETGRYIKAGISPDFATQSGPMLVIDGRLHPKFLPDSDSLKRRNGVGVDDDGMVHFVISEGLVRFHDFATFFRDRLGCRNALYLDGTISSMYSAETARHDRLFPMGPIIAVSDLVPR